MLLKCKECKKEISHGAGKCPACGCKKPFTGIQVLSKEIKDWDKSDIKDFTKSGGVIKTNLKPVKWFFTSIGILFVVMIFIGLNEESKLTPEQKAVRAEQREAKEAIDSKLKEEKKAIQDEKVKEYAWIAKGKDAVRARLKDSNSAEFKDVYFFRGVDNFPMTCGQVNSKNSFGGFVGFQRFVSGGSAALTFLQNEIDDFPTVWNKYCAK